MRKGGNTMQNEEQQFSIAVQNDAPVIAHKKILINAPSEKVISKISDINNWPAWRKSIVWSYPIPIDYPVDAGTDFRWKSGSLKYKSNVHTYTKNAFGWTGKTIGAYAVHNWSFKKVDDQTEVEVWESLNGFAIRLMKKNMSKELPRMLNQDLLELKEVCENKQVSLQNK